MNIRETINIPKGTKFLSEVLSELPHNCILDKGATAAGGTHIALSSKENYVICVPYKSIIRNKIDQKKYDIFGIDGSTTEQEIRSHFLDNKTCRFVVTYDSLWKVVSILDEYNHLGDYKILIDEFHLLITQYLFRNKAVRTVLDNYKLFKSYCFMTATILEDEFILDELMDLDVVIIRWEDVKEITVNSIKCDDIKDVVKPLIDNYLREDNPKNVYFFVNSVKFIKEMVIECKLKNKNCRGIWSENNDEVMPIKNSIPSSEPKKINFITSTCFEGLDMYDKNAEIYIISDGDKKHTLIDISTSFQQIAGRIRDADIKQINHIYTETRYSNYTNYDEYKEASNKLIAEGPKTIRILTNSINSLKEFEEPRYIVFRDALVREANVSYVSLIDDELTIDNNLIKLDLYNFKICKCLYDLRVNLIDEYYAKGYRVESFYIKSSNNKQTKEKRKTFKQLVDELQEDYDNEEVKKEAFGRYSFLEEAINKIDFEGIIELKYSICNIKKKLIILSDIGQENKILSLLKERVNSYNSNFISDYNLKNMFTEIYKDLNISRVAKSTDINKYYNTIPKTPTIDGNSVRGKVLLTERLLLG